MVRIIFECTYKILFILTVLITAGVYVLGYVNQNHDDFVNVYESILSNPHAKLVYDNRYLIAFACVLIIISIFIYTIVRIFRRWRNILQAMDVFILDYVQFKKEIEELILDHGSDIDRSFHDILADKSFQFIQSSLNKVSRIFASYTGRECHVSIKTFDKETGMVTTTCRDALSYRNRHAIDEYKKRYSFQENTAFSAILDPKGRDCFMSNHLRLCAFLGKYENSNDSWHKYYRATIVVPITEASHEKTITSDTVIGFICIDNKGGGFDRNTCKHLAYIFCRLYHAIFLLLGRVPTAS